MSHKQGIGYSWTAEEDKVLKDNMVELGPKGFKKLLPDRSDLACASRFYRLTKITPSEQWREKALRERITRGKTSMKRIAVKSDAEDVQPSSSNITIRMNNREITIAHNNDKNVKISADNNGIFIEF